MKLIRRVSPSFGMLFLAPTVNVLLTLIFFLLLSGTMLLQPGIAVRVPASPFLVETQEEPIVVSITAQPVPAIYFENRKVTVAELGRAFEKVREHAATVIIKADQRAPVDLLVQVVGKATDQGLGVVLGTTETR